jgi:hypothetical protein
MKNRNRFAKKLKEIAFWIVILSTAITTKGLCTTNNSINDPSQELIESSEKRKANDNTEKQSDINLFLNEDKQKKVYESLIVEINDLKQDFEQTKKELEQKVSYQMQCNENAINSVNTSISGASYSIKIFGIIITIASIGLGTFITIQLKNVTKLTRQNKSIYEIHLKIRDEVKQLDANIKNNMSKLYDDLKREETKSLVERLVNVPEDIQNLFPSLASREVPKEMYTKFKEAYHKASTIDKGPYLTLLFQHFPSIVFFDKDIEKDIEASYAGRMDDSFKNDIINSTIEFLKVCLGTDILEYRDKIKKYFIALSKTKHKNLPELHREIYKTLSAKENRFNFYSILKSASELNQISKIYGKYMLSDYKDATGNTDSEKKVLSEIVQEVEQEKKIAICWKSRFGLRNMSNYRILIKESGHRSKIRVTSH